MKKIFDYVQDQRGIETIEWILIGAVITAVAVAAYTGTLQPSLTTATTNVGNTVAGS